MVSIRDTFVAVVEVFGGELAGEGSWRWSSYRSVSEEAGKNAEDGEELGELHYRGVDTSKKSKYC